MQNNYFAPWIHIARTLIYIIFHIKNYLLYSLDKKLFHIAIKLLVIKKIHKYKRLIFFLTEHAHYSVNS
jgi:hypothetical protein